MSIEHDSSSRLHSRGVQCRVLLESTLEKWLQILVTVISLIYFAWHIATKDDIIELCSIGFTYCLVRVL